MCHSLSLSLSLPIYYLQYRGSLVLASSSLLITLSFGIPYKTFCPSTVPSPLRKTLLESPKGSSSKTITWGSHPYAPSATCRHIARTCIYMYMYATCMYVCTCTCGHAAILIVPVVFVPPQCVVGSGSVSLVSVSL